VLSLHLAYEYFVLVALALQAKKSWERLRQIQQRSDQVAGTLDGRPPDVQGASQSMYEES
jgi:hypothetical protein